MTTNVEKIKTVFGSLVHQRRWVCFAMNWQEDKQKYSKVPINPYTGRYAKSNEPSTWATLKTAAHYMDTHVGVAGVMIALSDTDDLVGVDIDNCRESEASEWSSLARKIIDLAQSYTEISPSGKGIRIFLRGELPQGKRKNSEIGVEMYDSGRFLTVTGNHILGTPEGICKREEAIKAIHSEYFGMEDSLLLENSTVDKIPRSISFDDEEILEMAINSGNGEKFESLFEGYWEEYYSSQSEADLALCCMLAFWTGWQAGQMDRIFRTSELYRDKWNKRHYGDGTTYGAAVIQKAIEASDQYYLQEAGEDDI